MRARWAWTLSLALGVAALPLALAAMDAALAGVPEGALAAASRLLLGVVPLAFALAAPRPWGVAAGVAACLAALAVLMWAGVRWADGPFDVVGLAFLFGLLLALPGAVLGAVGRALWAGLRRAPAT